MNAPCKNCPERHELCHMECGKYKAYRAERDALCERRKVDRITNGIRNGRRQKAYDNYQKRMMTR